MMNTEDLITQFEKKISQTALTDKMTFALIGIEQLAHSTATIEEVLPKYERFFDVSTLQLNALRNCIYQQIQPEKVREYASGMLRFLEVQHPKLAPKTRELLPNSSKTEIALRYKMALTFLLDYYESVHDIRILNAVLKAMNYDWIFSSKELETKTLTLNSLYAYRLLTLTERALRQISSR